jgi:hypothetical protein
MTPPAEMFFPVLHDCKTACLPAGGGEKLSAGVVIQLGLSLVDSNCALAATRDLTGESLHWM